MCDVTSCTLPHDKDKACGDPSPLTEYFVLDNRKQHAYASSILQLNLLRKDLDVEAEELEQRIAAAASRCLRPTTLPTSDDQKRNHYGRLMTTADVTAVPEIVSDCHQSIQNDVEASPVSNDDDTL